MTSFPEQRKDTRTLVTIMAIIVLTVVGLALAARLYVPATDETRSDASTSEPAGETASNGAPLVGAGEGSHWVTVPAGTLITVEFVDSVSSETDVAGDTFTARIVEPVVVDGEVALHAGDEVLGKVIEAVPAKKIGGQARLNLDFTALRLASGTEVELSAGFVHDGKNQNPKDAATIGAVGTAIAAANEGDPIEIPRGTVIDIRAVAPLSFPLG
jgi:hypothetical protein